MFLYGLFVLPFPSMTITEMKGKKNKLLTEEDGYALGTYNLTLQIEELVIFYSRSYTWTLLMFLLSLLGFNLFMSIIQCIHLYASHE